MGHRLSGSRSRFAASLMAIAVIVSACGSTPASSVAPSSDPGSAPGNIGNLTFSALAAKATDAQAEYAALLQSLRAAAGLIAALGPAGSSVYAFIDASEASALLDQATKLFPGVGSAGQVASAAGGGRPDAAPQQEAVPTVFMAWLVSSMVGMFPERDVSGSHGSGGSLPTGKDTFTSTENGVTTSTVVTTDIGAVSWDGNNRATTVTIGHTTTVTDATGKVIGHLTGTITSTIEFQGCPASDGLVIGRIRFTVQEGSAEAAAGGAFAKTTWEQNVHQYVGEDAWLTREESALTTDISIRGGIKTAGQAPDVANDWDASVGYTTNRVTTAAPTSASGLPDWQADATRPAQTTSSSDFRTVADQDAANTVIQDAVRSAAFVTGLPLLFITESAQKYWRNGNCVEVAILQGQGGMVDPGQHVQIVAQPRHKIDHVDLKKPTVAAFSGKAAAEPLGVSVPAPASFDFTAGEEQDKGTLTLTSTSNRGIGTTSLDFYVPIQDTPSPSLSSTPKPRPTATAPTAPTASDGLSALRGSIKYHYDLLVDSSHETRVVDIDMQLVLRVDKNDVVTMAGSGTYGASYHGTTQGCVVDGEGQGSITINNGEQSHVGSPMVGPHRLNLLGLRGDPIKVQKSGDFCSPGDEVSPLYSMYICEPPADVSGYPLGTGRTLGLYGKAGVSNGVFGYDFACSDTSSGDGIKVTETVSGFIEATAEP